VKGIVVNILHTP